MSYLPLAMIASLHPSAHWTLDEILTKVQNEQFRVHPSKQPACLTLQ